MGLLNRIFGGGKQAVVRPPFDLSLLQNDVHSHLIPGIDDGARSMDETIAMLAKFESLGYKKVITTPHIMGDHFKNTPEIILGGLKQVQETAKQLGLKIEIQAAAEYYLDDSLMTRLKNKEKLLTFGSNYLLYEFSMFSKPERVSELHFQFLTQGYKPVLAHFERYPYFHGSVKQAEKWREDGVLIQLNLNSLTGHYGPEIKTQAERMVDAQVVDFVGSDCHRIEHLMLLEKNLIRSYFHKLEKLPLLNQSL